MSETVEKSTFDIVKVDAFHNTRFWTIVTYLWVWILLILKIAILAGDTYTCVCILAFDKWSSDDYQVYEFKIAKWIFTGCILFRFVLLVYQLAWAIHIFRTRNIALAYLNNYARMMYVIRSYDYQCLFHAIELDGFFQWAAFFIYTQLDDALEILVADLPRQVINFMTLKFYATGGDLNSDIIGNIRAIATTNLRLSIILSFQLCTMVIFLFFFFQFVFAMIMFIPIKVKVSHRGFGLLKKFCYSLVNQNVRDLVMANHKSKKQMLQEGILDMDEIRENPLLASTSTFDFSEQNPSFGDQYEENGKSTVGTAVYELSNFSSSSLDYLSRPPPRTYTSTNRRFNSASSFGHPSQPEGFNQIKDPLDISVADSRYPFSDINAIHSHPSISNLDQALQEDPFEDPAPPRPNVQDLENSVTKTRLGFEDEGYGETTDERPFRRRPPDLEMAESINSTMNASEIQLIYLDKSESERENGESEREQGESESEQGESESEQGESESEQGESESEQGKSESGKGGIVVPYPLRGLSQYTEEDESDDDVKRRFK